MSEAVAKRSRAEHLADAAADAEVFVRQREWWRRLLQDKIAMAGAFVLAVFVLVALAAPVISPKDPLKTNPANKAAPVLSPGAPLGTDQVGRDILSRLIWGARLTLMIGIVGAAISTSIGLLLGVTAGYYGGWTDTVIMRGIDVLLAFPYILLAIVVVAILGPSLRNAILAISILGVPFYVRLVRSEVLRLREQEFVIAARAMGATGSRIVGRHIIPNVLAPIIVTASIHIGFLILSAAGLAFLGLGAQPPSPEWGAMVSSGRDFLIIAPHVVLVPSIAIFLVVLAFNVLGDGLRDALDPKAG